MRGSQNPARFAVRVLATMGILLVLSSGAALAQGASDRPANRSPAYALPTEAKVEAPNAPAAPLEPAAGQPASETSDDGKTEAANEQAPVADSPAAALPEAAKAEGADASTETTGQPDLAAISLEDLESLVTTLEDDESRTAFLDTLKALIEVRKGQTEEAPEALSVGTQVIETISQRAATIGQDLANTGEVLTQTPAALVIAFERLQEPDQQQRWIEIVTKIVIVLAAGLLFEWAISWLLRKPRASLEVRQAGRLMLMVFAFLRFLTLLVPIGAFAAASYGALSLVEPKFVTRIVAVTVINANIVVRVVMTAARVTLSPTSRSLRLVKVEDATAAYWFVLVRRLAIVVVYGYLIVEAAYILGLPYTAYREVLEFWGLLVLGVVIVLLMQIRGDVSKLIRGDITTGHIALFRRRFGDVWHVIAIVLAIATYAVWSLEIPGGFEFLIRAILLSLVIIVAARIAMHGLRNGLDRLFALNHEISRRHPLLEKRVNRYLPALTEVMQFVVFVFGIVLLLDVWGLGVGPAFSSDAGKAFLGGLAKIAIILVVAVVVWEIIAAVIESSLQKNAPTGRRARRTRFQTLLPLLRNALFVTIAVVTTITVLSELGLNVGPLLAGAGVVGLAIGFGAQTLVQDIITGIFILLEDAIAVGDVVDLGGHAGVVEGMTIRSVRMRDVAGDVHIVPFSQVNAVLNRTKEFSYALLEIGVAYRESVDDVIEILREVSEGLREDEEYSQDILEPLEVLGLERFGASSVDIRVRLKTVPLRQWAVRREFNRRIKNVFDERGIEIPFPHQTLYFGEDKDGRSPAAHIAVERVTRRREEKTAEEPEVMAEPAKSVEPEKKTEPEEAEEQAEDIDHGTIDATKAPG